MTDEVIAKLFRETFTGASPIQVDPQRKQALVESLGPRLRDAGGRVHPEIHEWFPSGLLQLGIPYPGRAGYQLSFRLELDQDNRLNIRRDPGIKAPVSSVEELETLIPRCQQFLKESVERQELQAVKRAKVRKLKEQAIMARVRQLVREDRFEYCTESNQRSLKLFIKVSEADCCELRLPFHRFDELLPDLPEAVRSLRTLYERGFHFGLHPLNAGRFDRNWMGPDE